MQRSIRGGGAIVGAAALVLSALAVAGVGCRRRGRPLPDRAALEAVLAVTPAISPTATPTPRPAPSDPAELRARARAALGPDRSLAALAAVGPESPFALGLEHPPRAGAPAVGTTLLLFDLGPDPGSLLAEHDFGVDGQALGGPGPARLAGVLALEDEAGRPVLLADLRPPARSHSAPVACGWWLAEDHPRFTCAPAVAGRSRYAMVDSVLYELWEAPSPVEALRPAGRNGRALLFRRGRWRETDSFRCLGWELPRALGEAGPRPLHRWQRSMVERLRAAARRARVRLDTREAVRLLGLALDVDACDAELWRVRGRLRLTAGDAARAAPDLAVALALRPTEPAGLLDLADALRALGRSRRGWRRVRDALARRGATAALLERSRAKGPADLARSLYEEFLAETAGAPARLAAQRRRARLGLEALSRAGARARSPGAG